MLLTSVPAHDDEFGVELDPSKLKGGYICDTMRIFIGYGKMAAVDTREEIMKLFEKFDAQKKGYIDYGDVKSIAKQLGENMTEEDLRNMVTQAGTNGRVSAEQFYKVLTRKPGQGTFANLVDGYDSSDDEGPAKVS